MNQKEIFKILKIEDTHDMPEAIMKILEGPEEDRNFIYDRFMAMFNCNLSYDWFQEIYESELAQRNENKQDFTPNSIGALLSKITGNQPGRIYEPTAGNGSLLIANWNNRQGEDYNSEENPIECWELSKRSIPILLFNLSIRNMAGTVYHGNVIENEIQAVYKLIPTEKYSKIVKL